MQIPVILSRGYSLDQLIWTDWFKRQHEQFHMDVKHRVINEEQYVVKVEIGMLGVPFIRGLFGLADSRSTKATYYINGAYLMNAYLWLNEAFNIEAVNKAAPLMDMSRRMGLVYLQPEDTEDTNQYYYDHLEKLNIQQQHFLHENDAHVEVPTPKSYSAFFDAVDEIAMPFDQDLTGEEDND